MKKVLSFLIAMGMVFGMTTAVNAATEKTGTMTDSCTDFGKVYEKEGMLEASHAFMYMTQDENQVTANEIGMAKGTKSGYVVYRVNGNINSVDVRGSVLGVSDYVNRTPNEDNNFYRISVSPDNKKYTDLKLKMQWGNQFGNKDTFETWDGRYHARFSSENIPEGMKYLKVELPELTDEAYAAGGANQSDYSRALYSVNIGYGSYTFTDSCANFDNIYEKDGLMDAVTSITYSGNWSSAYGMAKGTKYGYVVYRMDGNINSVDIRGSILGANDYVNRTPNSDNNFYRISVSKDNVTYTDLGLKMQWGSQFGFSNTFETWDGRFHARFASDNIPDGMKYLKIEFPELTEEAYAGGGTNQTDYSRLLYKVAIDYDSSGYVLKDKLADMSNIYESDGILAESQAISYSDNNGNSTNANALGMAKETKSGYVVYKFDGNITEVDIRGTIAAMGNYVNRAGSGDNNCYRISVSADNVTYTDLGLPMQWGPQFGYPNQLQTWDGRFHARFASDNIPAGMKYLKIEYPELNDAAYEAGGGDQFNYSRSLYSVYVRYSAEFVDVPSYNFTDGEDGKTTLTASVNAVGKDSEISVFAASYDENGKLVDCAMQKKNVSADATEDFEITVTKSAKTLGFVWSGEAPEAEILK